MFFVTGWLVPVVRRRLQGRGLLAAEVRAGPAAAARHAKVRRT